MLNRPPVEHDVSRLAVSPRYLLELFDGLWVWTRFALTQIPVPRALVLAPRVLALLVALGLQQAGFWLLAGIAEPSGEPGASEDETGAEPEPEQRADLHA